MLSMIFVIREVLELKRQGFRIEVASINDPDRTIDRLTEIERGEAQLTYYVKADGGSGALRAHWNALLRRPLGWLRGLRQVVRLGGVDVSRLVMHLIYFTEALMVGDWMRRRDLTHVHAHLGSQPATVALYVKAVFDVGMSITVHGPDEFYDVHRQCLAEKVAAADFICCISDFARSQLMKLAPYEHWHKLVVSRLGVDPTVFSVRPPRVVGSCFEVLCVGRLTPAKGQHVLLDAVAALRRQGRAVRLLVVGAGTDSESLQRHATALSLGDAVVFAGAVDQDGIRAFYAAADCFCLPSFAEGIPVVLMEAMAIGVPCVTTHITGIPELIRHEIDGLLVPPSNVDALVHALARLMDDAPLRQRLSQSARLRVSQDYDLARNVEQLARIFMQRVA